MEGETPLRAQPHAPKRTYKLMIVDDSSVTRTLIESSHNIDELELVGSVGDGYAALELFRTADPDIVTMDLTMPRMDGIECITRLVALKPSVRILVISALADKATAVEAMQKGANGFLTKPFSEYQLHAAIAALMEQGPQR